jgi:hypothetical protein
LLLLCDDIIGSLDLSPEDSKNFQEELNHLQQQNEEIVNNRGFIRGQSAMVDFNSYCQLFSHPNTFSGETS